MEFLAPLQLPRLTSEISAELDAELTLMEIKGTIKSLPLGKATGSDGFPLEFYKIMAPTVASWLLETFNEARDRHILPPTMREGHIAIILKKGQDSSDPALYRPITVINLDINILCKVLA